MENTIEKIKQEALKEIENINSLKTLDEVKNKYLSRNSELNNLKKSLKDLPNDKKPVIGSLLNKVSAELNSLIEQKFSVFYEKELNEKLLKEKIDITKDASYIPLGNVHPLTKTVNEIVEIYWVFL